MDRLGPQTQKPEMYELQVNSSSRLTGAGNDPQSFFTEISSIQDQIALLNQNVQRLDGLYITLSNNTEVDQQESQKELADLVNEVNRLGKDIRSRHQALSDVSRGNKMREPQLALVKKKFLEANQNLQAVQTRDRQRQGDRRERQYRIVNPNATDDEICAAREVDNDQIFTQALMSSNRYGEANSVYKNAQARNEDFKKMEKALADLCELFTQLASMVEQQDDTLNAIITTAQTIEKDTEAGFQQTEKAVVSARSARKKRWICFFLFLIILIIIAVVVAVVVINNNNKK